MSKQKLVLGLGAGVIVATALMMSSATLSAAFKRVQISQPPPAFSMKDLTGKEWQSAGLLEKSVTVVVFWATWNFRSGEILKDLESLRAELGPDKFQIVAINAERPEISSSDRAAIEKMIKEQELSSLVLLDNGLAAFNDYGAMALPSSLVVGEDGNVIFTMAGYPNTLRSDLSDAVRKALGMPTSVELRPVEEYVPKNHALMYYNLGRRLMAKGQEEKAEAQLLTSLERDPDFKKVHLELGLLYKKTGRHEEALREFQRVKELDPRDPEALYQVAVVSLRAGKFAEAEALFQELITEFPERAEFALGLALAHKYQGHQEEYKQSRDQAATLYPATANYYYDLGGVAEAQKDLAEAAGFYRQAIEKSLKLAQDKKPIS
jgi:tetratricopeptide (TPR) repeat protein